MNRLAVIALVAVSGCASVPDVRYFTLDMRPSGGTAPAVNFSDLRVSTAQPLSRAEIIIQKAPTEVEYYATAAWITRLDEIITEKLNAEFGPHDPGRRDLRADLQVRFFGQEDTPSGAEAVARVGVSYYDAESKERKPLLKRDYSVREKSEASPGAIVSALSRCVEAIAREMAADVSDLAATPASESAAP